MKHRNFKKLSSKQIQCIQEYAAFRLGGFPFCLQSSEASDILNASRRLNSKAQSETPKKRKRGEKRKGTTSPLWNRPFLICERAFKEYYWEKKAQIKNTMLDRKEEFQVEPEGVVAVNERLVQLRSNQKGNPGQDENEELLFF